MKRAFAVTLAVIVAVIGSVIWSSAGVVPSMTLNVPFSFYAGKNLMPAGDYIVEMSVVSSTSSTGSLIALRTVDGNVFCYLQTAYATRDKQPAHNATFTQYGGTYFLSRVQNNDVEVTLTKTSAEKETARAYHRRLHESKTRTIPGAIN